MKNSIDVMVVGYSNKNNVYENNWIKSINQTGYNYVIVGKGDEWNGWITRTKAYANYLFDQPPNNGTIYVFTDVYDLYANSIVDSPKKLISMFNETGKSIVVGTEPNCNNECRPVTEYWKEKIAKNEDSSNPKNDPFTLLQDSRNYNQIKNRYVNYGFICGLRNQLLDMYLYLIQDEKQSRTNWNDQRSLSYYIDQNPDIFHLDYKTNFVGNIICHPFNGNVSQYQEKRKAVYNKKYNNHPLFIHTPSKNIDGLNRYRRYGLIILNSDYEDRSIEYLSLPGYHWVWLTIITAIVVTILLIRHSNKTNHGINSSYINTFESIIIISLLIVIFLLLILYIWYIISLYT